MIRFLSARALRLLAVLLFASLLIYLSVYLAPGSPLAVLSGGRSLTPEQIEGLSAHYGLDEPFLTRYGNWLVGVFRGDLGDSLIYRQPVSTLIAQRTGTTALLVGYSSLLIVLGGLTLGVTAALRGRLLDVSIVATTGALAAVPPFVAAVTLVTLFAVGRSWFPVFGSGSGLVDQLWHLTLPAVALALASIGFIARVTRTSVMEERGREHVVIAQGRGLPGWRVLRRHILRNSMIPVTAAVGITVPSLIAGAVVIEQAFGLNGLGSLLVQSVLNKDLAVVQAVMLLLVAAFTIVNMSVDLVLPLLDPRMRARS